MRVLVMQQKMIGDVLTSGLLAENLRNLLPGIEVHFLAHSHTHAVLQGNPHIVALHGCAASATWGQKARLAAMLRSIGFEALIDVYGKLESLLLTARIGARRSIGYSKWYTGIVYSDPVVRPEHSAWDLPLAIEHRLRLLEPLTGRLERHQLAVHPRLYVDDAEHSRARSFLARHGVDLDRPLLMVGALGSSEDKTYPLPSMARLLDRIAAHSSAQLLFNCLPSQRPRAAELAALCTPSTRARIVLDAAPDGLRDFIAVLAQCSALFGNEGGAANMARALDVPSFSIFSPQIPRSVWASHDPMHPSVHLAEFAPAHFDPVRARQRPPGPWLYERFDPGWIEPALDAFVGTHLERT